MSDHLKIAQDRLARETAGDGPVQKHIILLKLTDLLENQPNFEGDGAFKVPSPQQSWLSSVGSLLKRLDKISKGTKFDAAAQTITYYRQEAVRSIKAQMVDAIEEIKLELELEGRDEIGSAYAPGDYYQYYADLKEILGGAKHQVFIIDPYFNGEAFDSYFSEVRTEMEIRILSHKYAADLKTYADKHAAQYGTNIELRQSKNLHDRLVIVDQGDCWITGGSIKQAGDKASYLIPLSPEIGAAKREIYSRIWDQAAAIT